MKKHLLLTTVLFLILITLNSCNNKKEFTNLNNQIEELNTEVKSLKGEIYNLNDLENLYEISSNTDESTDTNHDFCNTTEAIIKEVGKFWYNTKVGVAWFQIPIPEKSKLIQVKKTTNAVYYVCTGTNYNGKVRMKKKIVYGLSKEEGSELSIYVNFMHFERDDCQNKETFLVDKKKTSVVNGSPFWLELKK